MSYDLGLVVGKFAPLHKGHEFLIEAALQRCSEVLIVSYYRPAWPNSGPRERRAWLEERFPTARLLVLDEATFHRDHPELEWPSGDETRERRFVGALCRDVLQVKVSAVFTSESYGPPFALELERFYRERFPDYPAIPHVAVDPGRTRIPISGTRIRENVHAARAFLSDCVYASFVERVAILGGESSGKTTLARAAAARWGTAWVEEYGRTLWLERGGVLGFEDLSSIAERQVALEQRTARGAQRYLFCDTSPLVTRFYSEALFGRVDPRLAELAERPYAHYVVCAPDIPFEQDGTRQDEAFRERQHAFYLKALETRGLPCLLVQGSVEDRLAQLADWLQGPLTRERAG